MTPQIKWKSVSILTLFSTKQPTGPGWLFCFYYNSIFIFRWRFCHVLYLPAYAHSFTYSSEHLKTPSLALDCFFHYILFGVILFVFFPFVASTIRNAGKACFAGPGELPIDNERILNSVRYTSACAVRTDEKIMFLSI